MITQELAAAGGDWILGRSPVFCGDDHPMNENDDYPCSRILRLDKEGEIGAAGLDVEATEEVEAEGPRILQGDNLVLASQNDRLRYAAAGSGYRISVLNRDLRATASITDAAVPDEPESEEVILKKMLAASGKSKDDLESISNPREAFAEAMQEDIGEFLETRG